MEPFVLKWRPSDFLVQESVVLPLSTTEREFVYTYLRLRKVRLTTFEAIDKLAAALGVTSDRVGYAGLKDEDAITEQTVSVDAPIGDEWIRRFNCEHGWSESSFLSVSWAGSGPEPLRVGRLSGNSFRIIIRNLSFRFAERLEPSARYFVHFLNYYDLQRFGVPAGPKTTHLIGERLVREDYTGAYELLAKAGTPVSSKACAFRGDPGEFFQSLDKRVRNFFWSSYSSFLWNCKLAELVESVCGDDAYRESRESIPFVLTQRQQRILEVLTKRRSLEYTRYHDDGPGQPGIRATVIQAQMHCVSIEKDEFHPAAYRCEVLFFLPSGCYATMCLRQFVEADDLTGL